MSDLRKAAASATYAPPQRDGVAWSEGGLRCAFTRHNGVGYVTVVVPDLGTAWTEVAHDERHARALARSAVPALLKGKAPPAGVFRRLEGMVAMAKAVRTPREGREEVDAGPRGLFYVRLRKARPGEIRYQTKKPPGEGWVQHTSTRTGKSGWKYAPGGAGGAAEAKPPPKQRTPRAAAGGGTPRPPRGGAPQPVGAMRTRGAGGVGGGAAGGVGGAAGGLRERMADVTKEGKAPGTVTGARVRTPKGTTEVKAPGSSPTASMPAKGKGAGKSKAAATPKAGTKGKAPAAEAEVDPEYAPHESGKAWSELADYHAGEAASATDVHARGHHEGMSYAANLREIAGKAHAEGNAQLAERASGLSKKAQALAALHRARREASTDEERSALDTQIREGQIDLDNRADEFALPRQERAAAEAAPGGEAAPKPKEGGSKGKGKAKETAAQRNAREFKESEARRYSPTHEESGQSWQDVSDHHLREVRIKMVDKDGRVRPAQEIHHEQGYHQALGYAAELRALAADEHARDVAREESMPAAEKPKGGRFGGPSKGERRAMASLKSRAHNLSQQLEYLARCHWDMVHATDEKTRSRAQRGIASVHDDLRNLSTDVNLRRGLEPVLDMLGFGPPKASDVARQPGFGRSMTKGARTVRPPTAVAAAARRGLALREKQSPSNRGGTAVGLKRAADLAARRPISRDVLERMVSFFARHAVNRRAPGWRKGEEGYPSPGKQAWLLWGGDAGRAWAKAELRRMEREDGRAERKAERDADRAEEGT